MFAILFALSSLFASPPSEVARLQKHFDTVERELRAADSSGLTHQQRANRAELIRALGVYRDGARFPRNLDVHGMRPIFIDDRGVRCAMAHLIETHGGVELVARVAATDNYAYVSELQSDPALQAWLVTNGLTAAEAGRIQPSYPSPPGARCDAVRTCVDSTCEVTDDEQHFCSPACDASAVGTTQGCPRGIDDVQMECAQRGDRVLCMYPDPSPGSDGWPCDPAASGVCVHACLALDDDPTAGECVSPCSDSQACPAGYRCEARSEGADALRTCEPTPGDGGCATSTSPPWVLAVALFGLVLRRAKKHR